VYSSEAKIAIDWAFEAKLEGKVWTMLFLIVSSSSGVTDPSRILRISSITREVA